MALPQESRFNNFIYKKHTHTHLICSKLFFIIVVVSYFINFIINKNVVPLIPVIFVIYD